MHGDKAVEMGYDLGKAEDTDGGDSSEATLLCEGLSLPLKAMGTL